MLVSKPDCEKRQMSAAEMPLAGRTSGTSLPPRLQALDEVSKTPSAATFRSKETVELSSPAVVGSTTVMFCPVETGNVLVSEITASLAPSAATTTDTLLESVPSGFLI